MSKELILVINPGSTSTKVAIFRGSRQEDMREILHSGKELKKFPTIVAQFDFRKNAVMEYLKDRGIKVEELDAIACRGGVVGQLEPGAYLVDQTFADASYHAEVPHPANLAPVIGYEIARQANKKRGKTEKDIDAVRAYVYDPVCACGIPEKIYTITGLPEVKKPFMTHVLNSRAVSIEQAKRDGKKLEESTYIVAHLGGGITVNLVKGGRILDFIGDDEGGFSPERAGGLPGRYLVEVCYSGKYTEQEMQKKIKGKGGIMAYLGLNDLREVQKRIDAGDSYAKLIVDAMILQTAKDIASLAAVTYGTVDKIILTGGIAHSKSFIEELKKRVDFVAPVSVIPGTYEMEALAGGVLRVLHGEEEAHILE